MVKRVDRDDATERMLRRAFTAGPDDKEAGVCPDPELLGALAEHTLRPHDRTRVEAHVADCARCQALLAAIVRTMPEAAPAASWWQWRPGRWLVPVAAMALAAVTWAVIQEPWRSTEVHRETPVGTPAIGGATPPGSNAGASARFERPPAPPPPNQPMPHAEAKPAPPAAAPEEKQETAASRMAPAITGRRDRQDAAPSGESPNVMAGTPGKTADAVARKGVRPSAAPAPPPPPASPTAVAGIPSTASSGATVAGTSKVAQDAAAEGRASSAARDTRAQAAAPVSGAIAETVNVSHEILSPDPRSRWRLDPAGTISRSTDGGSSWHAQAPGTTGPLSAGSSPAPSVCWVVGARGTVLLSVDGQTWRQVPFPEPVDLTEVTATSDDAAVVATNDRRTYVTSDRGRSWTRR